MQAGYGPRSAKRQAIGLRRASFRNHSWFADVQQASRRMRMMRTFGRKSEIASRSRGSVAVITAVAIVLVVGACSAPAGSASDVGQSAAPASASPSPEAVAPSPTVIESSPATTQRFEGFGISFAYPSGWYARRGTIVPSGNETIAFVSPRELPSDCVENSQGGVCYGWPVTTLQPGGIVIAWRAHGMPGSKPPNGGDPTLVDGQPARISRGPAGQGCKAIGGDESIDVVVPPGAGQMGWIGIEACLAGPDHSAGEAAFAAMLTSAKLK